MGLGRGQKNRVRSLHTKKEIPKGLFSLHKPITLLRTDKEGNIYSRHVNIWLDTNTEYAPNLVVGFYAITEGVYAKNEPRRGNSNFIKQQIISSPEMAADKANDLVHEFLGYGYNAAPGVVLDYYFSPKALIRAWDMIHNSGEIPVKDVDLDQLVF